MLVYYVLYLLSSMSSIDKKKGDKQHEKNFCRYKKWRWLL